ncbi:hypothetical protein N0V86_006690 [Didymella sp. IMI 355093]|nr:hypothetical protein N0V86_006690 [Didymella sp. IMI 355093]
MAGQDRDQDPRDNIIASLKDQLQLQGQREAEITKKYVDLLLERVNSVSPNDQQAPILPAIRRGYQIVESQVATRQAELQLLNQQFEACSAQYEQLQNQFRTLLMTVDAFSAGSVSQHNTYIFQGQPTGTVPLEAILQDPPHGLAIRSAPAASQGETTEASDDL